ncbi:methionyl-tRNA formyltransferase [Candidatus Wolfebacteria bacterium]|nr:methionyl-tRNA formyltransferase [Candidatus Wolfebacteria bacterium]
MKFVFFGGRESRFAEIILQSLISAGIEPVETIRDAKKPIDIEHLKSLDVDFFIVAAFGKIIKQEVINIPHKGVIGVHPSLLPKYRGASPVQSVILNNEKETGTALFLIDKDVDHGPVIAMEKLNIEKDDTYTSLIEKLAKLSVKLIIKELPEYIAGEIKPKEQDHSQATFTKKFSGEDAYINLNDDAESNWFKIRALNPEPGTYTILKLKNNKELRLKILEANLIPVSNKSDSGEDNKLELVTIQPEGKKSMTYSAFLNGYKDKIIS